MKRIRETALYEFALTILKSVDIQVKSCLKYNAKCRDPPATTSSLLKSKLGLSEFKIKRFWRIARVYHGYSLNIYRLRDAWFHLVILVRRGTAYSYNDDFFPDEFDCMRAKCLEYTNENMLYIYLEGGLGGEALRINTIYILKKLLEVESECYKKIMEGVEGIIRRDHTRIIRSVTCLFRILKSYSTILSEILPFIPRSLNDLLLISPALGSILLRLGIRNDS